MATAQSHLDDPKMITVTFKIDKDSLRKLRLKAAERDQYGVSALLREMIKRDLEQE